MSEYSKPVQVLLNDRPVLKISESDVEVRSNDNEVLTLESGLDGHSDGAATLTANLTQGIPLSGFQINWMVLALNHTTIRPSFKIAGVRIDCEGRVMQAGFRSQVNDPNRSTVSFSGRVVSVTSDT